MILFSKNKLKFIDGNISKLGNNIHSFKVWKRFDVMIKGLWKDLKERFSKSDHFCISRGVFNQAKKKEC